MVTVNTATNTPTQISVFKAKTSIAALPAEQQPSWDDPKARSEAIALLAASPPLVSEDEVRKLRSQLTLVANGEAVVLQAGDCAEPITDTTRNVVDSKVHALTALGETLASKAAQPVVHIGRIGGQFGKPRSQTETVVGDSMLPTYRGALINDFFPSAHARRHDPARLQWAHAASSEILEHLRDSRGVRIWTSHEALVLDYELPQLRPASDGDLILASAHTVWIGARTNQPDHAHVELASRIINPVGCKVSATTTPDHLLAVVDKIDPDRQPGRFMLIARMGQQIGWLPRLIEAVRAKGHKPIWMTDPMHANTLTAADGRKTRYLDAIIKELIAFQKMVAEAGIHAGGVHLETTIDDVRECLRNAKDFRSRQEPYTTLCDPRLTTAQAAEVLSHWKTKA